MLRQLQIVSTLIDSTYHAAQAKLAEIEMLEVKNLLTAAQLEALHFQQGHFRKVVLLSALVVTVREKRNTRQIETNC